MEWMKGIFILSGVLVVVGVGGYFGYKAAFAMGETAGYESGYPAGEEAGYSSGRQDGYKEGEETGYSSGKAEGYSLGEAAGYISGKKAGYSEGKAEGYKEGEEAGYSSGKADGYEAGMEAGLGHGYTLRDLTYAEVATFLREDKTDENEYVEDAYGVYVCSHFAMDVCNNAEEQGLRCAFIELRYPESGHAIIAFNTTDKGLTYFDAITDEKVNPVVGKQYYQCIEPKPGYYYEKPSYDDTIMDILVIW